MFRVKVNGKQICALEKEENIINEVKKFINGEDVELTLERIVVDTEEEPMEEEEYIEEDEEEEYIEEELKNTYTSYGMPLEDYIALQKKANKKLDYGQLEQHINPENIENEYQFLRLDQYRPVDVYKLEKVLEKEGILMGEESNIVSICQDYNIDPVYFLVQSILETGHGRSKLAVGTFVEEIADEKAPIYDNESELIGYEMIPLEEPATVYNLYGIGAKDGTKKFKDRPYLLGLATAYNNGWTSVEEALRGACEFISSGYIHNETQQQNTIYKFRFNPQAEYIWHQYSTTVDYAKKVADLIEEYSYLWLEKPTVGYDYPEFE